MGRQISILVIEDEEAIREGLIDVLVFHKYEVDSAATGPEGLEKALTGSRPRPRTTRSSTASNSAPTTT
jgi:two-component system response regulator RegX3